MTDRRPGAGQTTSTAVAEASGAVGAPTVTAGRRAFPLAGLLAVAALSLVVALLATGGAPERGLAGLPDAGLLTGWSLPLARLLMHAAAVVTVGALVTATVLLHAPGAAAAPLTDDRLEAVRRSAPWAAGWALLAVVGSALTVSEVQGRPVWRLEPGDLPTAAWGIPQARALLLVALLAAVVSASARRVGTVLGGWAVLAVALIALLPAVLSGHGTDHGLQAVEAVALHVVAASLWVGGLLSLLHLGRQRGRLDPVVVQRFSVLALGCFCVVVTSGLVGAADRLLDSESAWSSSYARLVVSKALLLGVLGLAGWEHRRRSLPALAAGRSGVFLRLAVAELAVMAAAAGLAVALARSAPPLPPPSQEAAELSIHGATHATLLAGVPPFSFSSLLTQWRPDLLMLTFVVLAGCAYGTAVRRARAAGRDWPGRCVAAAGAAAVVGVLAFASGLAVYAPVMLSVQVGQLLVVLLVLPALLLLSVPVAAGRDLLPAPTPGGGGRDGAPAVGGRLQVALQDPVNGLGVLLVALIGLYSTPLLELSSRSEVVHLAVTLAALGLGVIVLWALAGSPAARSRTRRSRAEWCGGGLLILALLALRLATQERLLGEAWFTELDLAWLDPAREQQRAALVVLGFLLTGLLGVVWAYILRRRPVSPGAGPSASALASRRTVSVAGRRD